MAFENTKITVREIVIFLVPVVGWVISDAVGDAKTEAELKSVKMEVQYLSQAIGKDLRFTDAELQTLELSVQELRTSLQKTQLELAEIKARL